MAITRRRCTSISQGKRGKNLEAYTLLRSNQTPKVNLKVMPTDNEPGDIGEVGPPPLAPAVANAIAKLTGKRLRSLPFPETV